MHQSCSRNDDKPSASHEAPHNRRFISIYVFPTPSHMDPVQSTPRQHSSFAFLQILLLHLPLRLKSCCDLSVFHITTLQAFLCPSMSATCSAHLILLGYATVTIQITTLPPVHSLPHPS